MSGKKGKDLRPVGGKVITFNRRARRDYKIEETHEAGLELRGSEVKSLRAGQISLKDAYVDLANGELWLRNAHIEEYTPASRENHDPERPRKLLMHAREIRRLGMRVAAQGFTIVPLSLYFKGQRVKVQVAVCHGKRTVDKRQTIVEREAKRELDRVRRRKD